MRGSTVQERHAFEEELSPQPTSVAQARRLVRRLLTEADREDLLEPATLLVSEIVTNAMLHAGTPILLRGALTSEGLRVEVGDGSPHLPTRRRYGPTAGTGRGMMLLEQLVDDWGATRNPDGKTVWFRLSRGERDERPSAAAPSDEGAPQESADAVSVVLQNVPLLLHAAWREHAEALLREYLLASLDADGPEDPIQVHAEATDAIAVLEEHVPSADVAVEPDGLMERATEPRVSADLLRVPVPRESVPHFETLDRAIEDALELAGSGLVTTPPTQPEIRAFRHWLCQEVLGQAAGGLPVPWSMDAEPQTVSGPRVEWDATPVSEATVAILAADDRNRILAASPPALDLLGYDAPGELLGRRIVAIIPDRLRQAHVAGFTLYLLVGRRPLVDTPVVVPARRRDGEEVEVRLTVTVQQAGHGRSVFLAELSPVA